MNPQCKHCRWAESCTFSLLWDMMGEDECGLFEKADTKEGYA